MRVALVLFISYVLVLIKLLFFRTRLVFSDLDISRQKAGSLKQVYRGANFVPFRSISHYTSGQEPHMVEVVNLFGNVLLFVPMGFFIPYFFSRINSVGRLVLSVAMTSFSVEVIQLFTKTGEFDVDDVLLNTAGGLLGYMVFKAFRNLREKKKPGGYR